jgi:23S rRNA (cytosine1962-C5)-methyltransferase
VARATGALSPLAAAGSGRAPAAARVILRPGREARLRAGHLWVYKSDIARVAGDFEPGDALQVGDARGRLLGAGYYNPASTIAVRLLTRGRGEIPGPDLIRRRIEQALAYRRRVTDGAPLMRLVSSEGDALPGLIVDRYADWLVVQIGTLGMERQRDAIVAALVDLLSPRGIFERSDLSVRAHEGLEPRTGVLHGEVPETAEATLDGLRLEVPLRGGQKTGLFLDQRPNRLALRPFARGRRVLDLFCNTGGFALHALAGGAVEAIGVDLSADAVAAASRNAERNGFASRARFLEANAFDVLKDLDRRHERFDLIVLDPPAFTKSRSSVPAARRGYKEINLRALRLASPEAIVVTSSCSFHLGPEEFLAVVREAAADAEREVTLLSLAGQGPDHPVNLGVPETRYLKCAFLALR